jgi:hypothetical protein
MSMLGQQTLNVTRYSSGGFVDGEWVEGAASAFTIQASVQPVNGRELETLPEGQRTRRTYKVYTDTLLQVATPESRSDRIAYGTKALEVQSVKDYSTHMTGLPHYKVLASEPGSDGL